MNKKEIIEYLKNNEIDVQSAKANVFIADLVYQAYAESKEIHGIKFDPVFCYFNFNELESFYQFLRKDAMNSISKKIYSDFLEKPESLDKKIDNHNKLTKEIDLIWERYIKKQGDISKNDLVNIFKEITSKAHEWWKYGVIGEDKGEVINSEVVPRFQKRHDIDFEKAKKIIETFAHPDEPAFFNKERDLFLEICLSVIDFKKGEVGKVINDEKILYLIDKYIKDFFWFQTDFYSRKVVTRESLLEKVNDEISEKGKKGIIKEIKLTEKSLSEIKKKKKELLESSNLSKNDLRDIEFSKEIMTWFDNRKLGTMKQVYYLFDLLEKIAEENNLSYHDLSLYSVEEIQRLLDEGVKIKEDEIKKRNGNAFIAFEEKNKSCFCGDFGKELFNIVLDSQKSNTLKGVVASKGSKEIVQGRANIVINPENSSFNEGDILVTSMTRVEFVPIMRKAKAIITNEGGIACHAAIVSRELGIPAIIGTKVATETLKDGDKIEMDMKTGEIKII